jgi:hypothetical protein
LSNLSGDDYPLRYLGNLSNFFIKVYLRRCLYCRAQLFARAALLWPYGLSIGGGAVVTLGRFMAAKLGPYEGPSQILKGWVNSDG